MAGGLMQLVAYGAQDVFLTGNPKVTFFQAVYKRHTNFAMENIEQTVNGSAGNSGRISVTVARNGDLVGEMYMELTTVSTLSSTEVGGAAPSGCWAAERAITDVELSIGGQRIDKHYQRWWRLYSELYLDEAKKVNWGKLTTNAGQGATEVYLPLIFFFNRNPGLYLPLIALQYHEVRLDFDLAADFQTYFNTTGVKVWANYIYLDTEERRRFAQKGHEYLIEQVQHTGSDSVTVNSGSVGTKQVRLSYNHPVKELVWCFNDGDGSNAGMWNFCSNAATSGSVVLESNPTAIADSNCLVPTTWGTGAPMYLVGTNGSAAQWVEEGVASGTGHNVGPLSTFKLILNGQDRFKEQDGKYFNQMQPFNHHSGSPYPGIYSYSFALKPEEHQPTGTCNFSRIDNAQVECVMKANADTAVNSTLNMFAVNYNVLRIQSGMGGLAFSN
jgi:hypothetical protein